MVRLTRFALIPLTLAASAPALAQADAAAMQAPAAASPGVLGKMEHLKLYPLAGTQLDPLSNVAGTSIAGVPVDTAPLSAAVSDGLPVGDLPVLHGLSQAQAAQTPQN